MPRPKAFNNSKARNRKICGQRRNDHKFVKSCPYPKESCFIKSGFSYQAFGFSSEQINHACTYCSEFLQEDECHIDDMSNQLCCVSCLWSSDRSANWWGHDTAVEYDEEEDSFDVDCGSADDDLIGEVP